MDSAGKRESSQTMHGPPLQARVAAANRTVCTTPNDDPGAHGMNGGKQRKTERGQTMRRAVGMAWQRRAGKHSPQDKAAAGEHSRQMICPAQALKHTTANSWPASQQNNSCQMMLAGLSPCSAGRWRECGGAGTQEAGSDLPTCLPPNLSPLPVTVNTHSLNL